MADKTPEQEPSIEEILASIRQIISEDDDKEDAAPAAPEPDPVPQFKPDPVPEPPMPAPPVEEVVAEEDILELNDPLPPEEPLTPPRIEMQDAFEPAIEEPSPMPAAPHEPLLDDIARQATIASMAKLAGNMPVSRSRNHGTVTLEDIVREILHPMLKDWMNENLPPMVERIVQKELEKLARQAQDV